MSGLAPGPSDPMELARHAAIEGLLNDVPDPATISRQTLARVIGTAFDCGAITAQSMEVAIQQN